MTSEFSARDEAQSVTTSVAHIRALNDAFRTRGPDQAGWLLTQGVQSFGSLFALAAVEAVRGFAAFDAGDDPYEEHDFGAFDLRGERLFWKIDYYDLDATFGSPDPADETVTKRVLTIMLASEY